MTGKIVTIAQQKGGAGKTTVSAHLAVAWAAMKGKSVALVDVDPQGSLGEWFEAREGAFGEDSAGLEFRTASGWGARREAQRLTRDFDFVVIDTPPHADLDAKPAIEAADLVVIPVQPTPVDLWATRSTLELLGDNGPQGVIVLNRVPPRSRLTGEMITAIREFGGDIAKNTLGNRILYASCLGEGMTAMEKARTSKAAREVEALAKEIAKRLS